MKFLMSLLLVAVASMQYSCSKSQKENESVELPEDLGPEFFVVQSSDEGAVDAKVTSKDGPSDESQEETRIVSRLNLDLKLNSS